MLWTVQYIADTFSDFQSITRGVVSSPKCMFTEYFVGPDSTRVEYKKRACLRKLLPEFYRPTSLFLFVLHLGPPSPIDAIATVLIANTNMSCWGRLFGSVSQLDSQVWRRI
jgi:hypothetical protein